ncbi:MAG: hypothetical protein GY810_07190 [Aureispira sp.]|nr:hypothetical protein [Aureispira sp.]
MIKYSLAFAILFIIGCSPAGDQDSNNNNNDNSATQNANSSTQNSDREGLEAFLKTASEGCSVEDSLDNIYIIDDMGEFVAFDENSDKVLFRGEYCKIKDNQIECLGFEKKANNADTLKTINFPENYGLDKSEYCVLDQFVIDTKSRTVNKVGQKVNYCEEH